MAGAGRFFLACAPRLFFKSPAKESSMKRAAGYGFRALKKGDRVEFEVNEGPKGLQAINVIKV